MDVCDSVFLVIGSYLYISILPNAWYSYIYIYIYRERERERERAEENDR